MRIPFRLRPIRSEQGATLVEAALAVPILLLLFAGCVQLIQIGLAHIVVMEAAYEAARQAVIHGNDEGAGRQTAEDICRAISSGSTTFAGESGQYVVTHQLRSLFPVVRNVTIRHASPAFLFPTEGQDQ